jgi:PAS domain S-box-containing protein
MDNHLKIYRPMPIDKEIKFSKKKFIVSKTDIHGIITFANKNFCDISGYSEEMLIGVPHNIIRHPDMPRAIFFLIWSSLLKGDPVSGVVKNLARSGKYYWVIADFDVRKDMEGNIKSLTAFSRAAPQHVIDVMEELYDSMLHMEKRHGMEGSLSYLEAYLDDKEMNYEEFLDDLVTPKGIIAKLTTTLKNIF